MSAQLQGGLHDALDDLRDLARGIYPPLLADKGLAVALDAQVRKAAVADHGRAGRDRPLPTGGRGRRLLLTLEAVQNVAKYAEATGAPRSSGWPPRGRGVSSSRSRTTAEDSTPATTTYGTGLQGMGDRLAVFGAEAPDDNAAGLLALFGLTAIAYSVVGTAIVRRTPSNAIG